MALQADKKRLLMFFASIGFIIVFSQVVGYQLSVSKRPGSSRGVLLPSAQAALRRESSQKDRERSVLLLDLLSGSGENAVRSQATVSLNLKDAPGASRLLVDMCVFNKLAGKQLVSSTRFAGGVETALGSPITKLLPSNAEELLRAPAQLFASPGIVAIAVGGTDADQGILAFFTESGSGTSTTDGTWLPIGNLEGSSIETVSKVLQGLSLEIKDCRQMS